MHIVKVNHFIITKSEKLSFGNNILLSILHLSLIFSCTMIQTLTRSVKHIDLIR